MLKARTKLTPTSTRTREQLILAAERLFARDGLDNVSLRQINAEAGQRNSSASVISGSGAASGTGGEAGDGRPAAPPNTAALVVLVRRGAFASSSYVRRGPAAVLPSCWRLPKLMV